MPIPNPQVLIAFLEDYFKIKGAPAETYVGSGIKILTSVATNLSLVKDLQEERKALIQEYLTKFSNAKCVADWCVIATDLGERARHAQGEKSLTGYSNLALTLNAMRSYIINVFMEHNDDTNKQFLAEINDRLEILNKGKKATRDGQSDTLSLREKYHKDRKDGVPYEYSRKTMQTMLLALADLGHEDSLVEALDHNLFNYPLPTDEYITPDLKNRINKNFPLCYQKSFEVIFYVQHLYKFHPIPDELKVQWGIPLEKKDEHFRYSEFLEQAEKNGQTVPNDKITRELTARKTRGHNFADSINTNLTGPRRPIKQGAGLFQGESSNPSRRSSTPQIESAQEEPADSSPSMQ